MKQKTLLHYGSSIISCKVAIKQKHHYLIILALGYLDSKERESNDAIAKTIDHHN